jgi:hypothetical protein
MQDPWITENIMALKYLLLIFNDEMKLNLAVLKYCYVMGWLLTGVRLVSGFTEHLTLVTTNNYDSLTELHTPKITVTTAHIKSSQASLAVAW